MSVDGARIAPQRWAMSIRLLFAHRWVRVAAVVILVGDLLLLAGNLVFLTVDEPLREPTHPVFSDLRWNGDNDASYIEYFGYLQTALAAVLLAAATRRLSSGAYLAWSLVLVWILADDVLGLHEKGGEALVASGADGAFGLGAQDVGELIVWAVAGAVLLPLVAVAHLRTHREARRDSWILFALVALLAFFAVGVDMLKVVILDSLTPFTLTALTLVETGGELLGMGLIALFAMAVITRSTPSARAGS